MKKFIIQAILLLLIIGGAIIFYNESQSSGRTNIPFFPQSPAYKDISIDGKIIKAEIASTDNKRKKGLGDRESLATDSGMLFIFDRADKYPFWMKGMKFPLDFIWIRDNKVVDILENIPAPKPGEQDTSLPVYSSNVPIDEVLEVNGGVVKNLGIKVGDSIK